MPIIVFDNFFFILLTFHHAQRTRAMLSENWAEPSPKRRILDSSKLKEIADNSFEFDEFGRKFSKQVENTAGKGEIAPYEQFLLFPQCFQKSCTADT